MDNKTYSLAEVLDPSRITRLSFPYEPAPEELEVDHKLLMNLNIQTCDAKPLEEYDRALGELLNGAYKDDDDATISTFILDSLGPLMDKNNVNMESN